MEKSWFQKLELPDIAIIPIFSPKKDKIAALQDKQQALTQSVCKKLIIKFVRRYTKDGGLCSRSVLLADCSKTSPNCIDGFEDGLTQALREEEIFMIEGEYFTCHRQSKFRSLDADWY